MVKPGGTGRPMRHISARFAPLPPSSGFIVPLPSVFFPNAYTYFPAAFGAALAALFFTEAFFATLFVPPLFFATTRPAFFFAKSALRNYFGNIRNAQDQIAERCHQSKPRDADLLVLRHHQHIVKKLRHR